MMVISLQYRPSEIRLQRKSKYKNVLRSGFQLLSGSDLNRTISFADIGNE